MKKLPLHIQRLELDSSDDKYREALELQRKHVRIIIEGVDFAVQGDKILQIMQKHGSRIQRIDVKHIRIFTNADSIEKFIKFMNAAPILKKITFDSVGLFHKNLTGAEIENVIEKFPVEAKKLSKVVMSDSNMYVLHFIENAKITSLKQDQMIVQRVLLKNLPHLEEFAIHKFLFTWFQIDFEKISCPLKRLSLLGCKYDSNNSPMLFITKIKNTLEELEIGRKFKFDFYQRVFNELKNLRVLKIHMHKMPEFDLKLQLLESVKTLILYAENENFDERIEQFIGVLPNVETLVMKWCVEAENERPITNQQMTFIANNMQKLRVLQLRVIDNDTFTNVSLPSLRELHLTFHRFLMHYGFKTIAESCPNIEKIIISSVHSNHFCSPAAVSVITNEFTKLKYLELGNGFYAVKQNFDDFLNCSTLKTVRLLHKALRDDPKMADGFTKSDKRLILHTGPYAEKYDHEIDFDLWANEEEYWASWEMKRSMRDDMGEDYQSSESSEEDFFESDQEWSDEEEE